MSSLSPLGGVVGEPCYSPGQQKAEDGWGQCFGSAWPLDTMLGTSKLSEIIKWGWGGLGGGGKYMCVVFFQLLYGFEPHSSVSVYAGTQLAVSPYFTKKVNSTKNPLCFSIRSKVKIKKRNLTVSLWYTLRNTCLLSSEAASSQHSLVEHHLSVKEKEFFLIIFCEML